MLNDKELFILLTLEFVENVQPVPGVLKFDAGETPELGIDVDERPGEKIGYVVFVITPEPYTPFETVPDGSPNVIAFGEKLNVFPYRLSI